MNNPVVDQFEEINGRLIEHRKAMIERDRILSLMATLDEQLFARRQTLADLEHRLALEWEDVEALESLSITAVINKLLGNHEEKLEKEVAEYLQAKMDVEACQISIGSLENNLHEMEQMLVALADCDDALAATEAEQKQFLIRKAGIHPKKLSAIPKQIGQQQAFLAELDEAVELGNTIHQELDEIIRLISSGHKITLRPNQQTIEHYAGIGRVVLLANRLQPKCDLFQLECQDVNSPLLSHPDLAIPRYNDVMGGEEATSLHYYRVKTWQQHLWEIQEELEQKLQVLQNKKVHTLEQINKLTQLQADLMSKLWQLDHFT